MHSERLTVFVAGDDPKSKDEVRKLAQDIGFDSVDAGLLKSARYGRLNTHSAMGSRWAPTSAYGS